MANNYLITGYWGEPHVTAENDRGINAAMFGTGRFVLPVGKQFEAEYIGNNTIRMYDGKLMDNGAAAGIPAGEYVDLLIANAGQGMKRNDLIVFQYSQDTSTLIESGKFVVVQGKETTGTAVDPVLTQGDLLSGKATFDQMALWRISVSGTTVSAPVKVFSLHQNIVSHAEDKNNPHEITAEQIGAAPEGNYATETFVSNKIAEAKLAGSDVDLSGYVSKDGGNLTGSLTVEATPSGSQGYKIQKTVESKLEELRLLITSSGLPIVSFYEGGTLLNRMVLNRDYTSFNKPVTVASGGTGASTAEQALANLGAMRQTLVWENTSRTSSFSKQGWTASGLSEYDEFLIYFCLNASDQNDWIIGGRCPSGETLVCNFVWADDGIKYHRAVKTGGSFNFEDGYRQGVVDNKACIPYQIYGIKGVVK